MDATVPFIDVCNLFEQVSTASNLDSKRSALNEFLTNYRSKADEFQKQHPLLHKSFYPILRLLLPNEERERGPYNLRDFTFSKTLINILGLDRHGQDATLLKNYKTSKNRAINSFADAAHFVLTKRFTNKSSLNVQQINLHLDSISGLANEIRAQEAAILDLLKVTSPAEQKWLVRILLKELRLGIGRDNILKVFHADAVALYNSVHCLIKTTDLLNDPSIRISSKVVITVFTSFQPMLSTRCDSGELSKIFKGDKVYYIEEKFDGERFQLHMKDGRFKYFSRRGFDYSRFFGESYDCKDYTSRLKNVFREDVKSLVLDGEMMVWHKLNNCFSSKGVSVDVKTVNSYNKVFQPCFCVFDLLLLNDEVMSDTPLQKRQEVLKGIIIPVTGVIMVSNHTEAKNKSDIIAALNATMDKNQEGIVFKDPNSTYVPASRKGWWKVKLEYFKNVMSDLDVLIIGGYFGGGKQKTKVTGFLVGVLDKTYTETKYLSFAKIASGLNHTEYKQLDQQLSEHWHVVDGKKHQTFNIFWGKEVPDVWIKPEDSCCLLVRGSELVKSHGTNPDYTTSCTLRFPRILKIRPDKPYYDCLSLAELDSLTSSGIVTKLSKRHLEVSDLDVEVKKTRSSYDYKFVPVESKSDLLEGLEFLVLSGTAEWTKDDVETAVRENGGKIVRAEGRTTFCMLAGDVHLRISTYKGPVDIVKLEWLRSILNEGEMIPYKPQDTIYTSEKTKLRFTKLYDRFGDPFIELATVKSLKNIVDNVFSGEFEKDNYYELMPSEVKQLNLEMNIEDDGKVFRGYNVYFDKHETINDSTTPRRPFKFLDEIDFIHRGGTVCDTLNEDCHFIISNIEDDFRIQELKSYLESINHTCAQIVNEPKDILNSNSFHK